MSNKNFFSFYAPLDLENKGFQDKIQGLLSYNWNYIHFLRIKALLPANGSTYAADTVKKARKIGKYLLENRFPNCEVTDPAIQLTVNLEIKYELFMQADSVIKTGQLGYSQVFHYLAFCSIE